MADPTAVIGAYAYQIMSGYDIWKPDEYNVLMAKYNDQGATFHNMIGMLGFSKPVARDIYYWTEDDWIHENFRVLGTVADQGAGNELEVTLHGDSVDSNNRYYPRLYDEVIMPNESPGLIVDIDVTTPTAPVIKIEPLDATDTLGGVTAGDYIAIPSDAFAERSGQPDGRIANVNKYYNYAQIIKETIQVSGSELTRQEWIDSWKVMPNDKNPNRPFLYHKAINFDLDYRISLAQGGAYLVGKKTTNTSVVDQTSGLAIRTTEGLIPSIRGRGNVYPKAVGSFALTDWKAINKVLDKKYVSNNVLMLLGVDRHHEIEDLLKTEMANTNINFAKQASNAALFNNNDSLSLAINFKYLVYGERTFHMKRCPEFHHPKVLGTTGYSYEDMAIILPLNKKKVNGEMTSYFGERYRQLGTYNRKYELWDVGGAGEGLKVTDIDERNTYLRTHSGFHCMCPEQMLLISAA